MDPTHPAIHVQATAAAAAVVTAAAAGIYCHPDPAELACPSEEDFFIIRTLSVLFDHPLSGHCIACALQPLPELNIFTSPLLLLPLKRRDKITH